MSTLALLAAFACIVFALLAPAADEVHQTPKKGKPTGGKPRRAPTPARKSNMKISRRPFGSLVDRLQRRFQARLYAQSRKASADVAIAIDDVASDLAEVVAESAALHSSPIVWPQMIEPAAGDLRIEQRRDLVRVLDSVDAPWCIVILQAALEQERDPEMRQAIVVALEANSHTTRDRDHDAAMGEDPQLGVSA